MEQNQTLNFCGSGRILGQNWGKPVSDTVRGRPVRFFYIIDIPLVSVLDHPAYRVRYPRLPDGTYFEPASALSSSFGNSKPSPACIAFHLSENNPKYSFFASSIAHAGN